MAKQLPYFKFFVSEWSDGDITIEDYNIQGLFINICSYYWSKECELSTKILYKRFKHSKDEIDYLIDEGHLKQVDDFIVINFLDEQKRDRTAVRQSKVNGGKATQKKRREKAEAQSEHMLETNSADAIESKWYDWFCESFVLNSLEHRKKKSYLRSLTKSAQDSLKVILKDFTQDDVKKAIVGLMIQRSFPNQQEFANDPTHLLKDDGVFIGKYLGAYESGDREIYGKIKKFE